MWSSSAPSSSLCCWLYSSTTVKHLLPPTTPYEKRKRSTNLSESGGNRFTATRQEVAPSLWLKHTHRSMDVALQWSNAFRMRLPTLIWDQRQYMVHYHGTLLSNLLQIGVQVLRKIRIYWKIVSCQLFQKKSNFGVLYKVEKALNFRVLQCFF